MRIASSASPVASCARFSCAAAIASALAVADDRLLLLPNAREDRLTRFSVGSVFRQLTVAGFAPITRLTVVRNKSSVEFYDFESVRTEFGISRAF